jgi:hypothetical protein
LNEFLFKFSLEIVLRFFSDLKSSVDFGDDIGFFFCKLNFLSELIFYKCFSVELFTIEFSFCLHSRVYIFVDNKSLSSHPYIFFSYYLNICILYINDLAVFFKGVKEGVFEFIYGNLFVEIMNVNSIIWWVDLWPLFYFFFPKTYLFIRLVLRT